MACPPPAAPPDVVPAPLDQPRILSSLATRVEVNNILRELDLTFLSERMIAMPSRYYAAVSVVCDIVCPLCPRQYHGELVDNGVMSYDAFARLAPYLKFADFAGLFGLGEPFLHKDVMGFIREAKRTGAWTTTSSHGMSLTEEVVNRIIDERLDDISVSMDGATRATFEKLRAGADFDVVCRHLRRMAEIKRERGVTHPTLQLACVVSRHNVAEMPAMVRLARELGAYQIVFSNLIVINPDNEHLSVVGTPLFEKQLARARQTGEKLGIPVHFFHQKPFPWMEDTATADAAGTKRYGCYEAWKAFTLDRRGVVKPCCYLEETMGNVFEESPEEVRNSEVFLGLRRALRAGRPNEFCQACGNLREATSDHVARHLAEARRLFDAADLTPDERDMLGALLEEYEAAAREAC